MIEQFCDIFIRINIHIEGDLISFRPLNNDVTRLSYDVTTLFRKSSFL